MRVAADHREAILQTAAKLFARKPFHEVLMDEVAEHAGIAKGTVYRYYQSKEDLFAALAMRHLEMLEAAIGRASAEQEPPLQRLRTMVLRLAEVVSENSDFFQVLMRHECNLSAQSTQELFARGQVTRDHFHSVVEAACNDGTLSCPFDIHIAADMLLGMIRSVHRFTTPSPHPAQVTTMAMHLFLNGLGNRPDSAQLTGGAR